MMTSPEPKQIKVVFLVFYHEAWDALAGIHDLMAADSKFEVTVISIPRRFSLEAGFGEESDDRA
jgi:hypothetical protein